MSTITLRRPRRQGRSNPTIGTELEAVTVALAAVKPSCTRLNRCGGAQRASLRPPWLSLGVDPLVGTPTPGAGGFALACGGTGAASGQGAAGGSTAAG